MTFAVVACSNCHGLWITRHDHARQRGTTLECPTCGTTTTGEKPVLKRADTREAACEKRAQLLAEHAGELNRYEDTPGYAASEPDLTPATTTGTRNAREAHRQKYSEFVDVTETLGSDILNDNITNRSGIGRNKYADEAAAVLGTVGIGTDRDAPVATRFDATGLPDINHPEVTTPTTATPDDLVALETPDDAGLTVTRPHAHPDTTTTTAHHPITTVWRNLIDNDTIRDALLTGLRTVATIMDSHKETEELLDAIGITDTADTGNFARGLLLQLRDLARRNPDESSPSTAEWKSLANLLTAARKLGTGHSTVNDIHCFADVLRFAQHTYDDDVPTPTVAVKIEYTEFEGLREDQRVDVCKVLDTLRQAFDLRIVATGVTQRYLRDKHRDDLPGVPSDRTAHCTDQHIYNAVTDLRPTASSNGPVRVLRALYAAPGDTLTYTDLYETIENKPETVRGYISQLTTHDLVESFGSSNDRKLSLLEPGREVLEIINREFGEQITLQNSVQQTPNPVRQRRVTRDRMEEPSEESSETAQHSTALNTTESGSSGSMYRTVSMSVTMRDAISAVGLETGSVTAVTDGIEESNSPVQFVSVDDDRGEVIVSVHATNPLEYMMSSSVAFSDEDFLSSALDDETLSKIVDDFPAEILRDARQIGYLTEEVLSEPSKVRGVLESWGENVEQLMQLLDSGEYSDDMFESEEDLLSELLREAHGLVGSVVHLLDLAGYDVIRDIRVPGKLNSGKVGALAQSVVHGLVIQSRYKQFAAYRQQFERREKKIKRAFTAQVDAADPTGTLSGSVVLRGGGAKRVSSALEPLLQGCEPREDAPEFNVPVSFRSPGRRDVAVAVTRVLRRKNLNVTREAVSVIDAVVNSPVTAARAVERLGSEPDSRDVEPVEVRYALKGVDASDVLPELPRSAGEVLSELLRAEKPLKQSELTDRVGRSGETVRKYRSVLVELGLVRETTDGFRVALPFRYERGDGEVPETCSTSVESVVQGIEESISGGVAAGVERVARALTDDSLPEPGGGGEGRVSSVAGGGSVVRVGHQVEQTAIVDVEASSGASGVTGSDALSGSAEGRMEGNERNDSVE